MKQNQGNDKQTKSEAVKVDDRGRISLPKEIRDKIGVESGDTLFMRWKNGVLEIRKAIDPFDVLTTHVQEEIEDVVSDLGLDLA